TWPISPRPTPRSASPRSIPTLRSRTTSTSTRAACVRPRAGACGSPARAPPFPHAPKPVFAPTPRAPACQECHRLDIEPAVTTREVPHGDPRAAVAMIDEFYASLALNGVADSFTKAFGTPGEGLLRRTGDPTPAERQDALRLASRKARAVAVDLF